MTLGEAILKLRTDNKDLDDGIASGKKKAEGLQVDFQKIGKNLSTYVTLPLAGIAAASIKAASNAEEIGSKFDAVFKNLSGGVRTWADDQAKALNRSATDFEQYLSTFQDTFVPLGFARDVSADLAKQLTILTTDLASFNNTAEPDTARALTSALVGNHEAVRGLGVMITEATLKQELFNMGIKGGTQNATEQEKVMARLSIIMKSTSDAHGDAARTSESFSNQMRGLEGNLKEAGETIGVILIPHVLTLMDGINGLLGFFKELNPATQNLVVGFGAVAAATGPLALGIHGATKATELLTTGWGTAAKGVATFGGAVKNIKFAVGNDLVGALSGGEKALLTFAKAGVLAAGAFVGWKIGEWASQFEVVQGPIDSFLKQLEKIDKFAFSGAIGGWLTGTATATKNATEATKGLESALKAKGITVDRAGKSDQEYAKAMREAWVSAGNLKDQTDKVRAATNALVPVINTAKGGLGAISTTMKLVEAAFKAGDITAKDFAAAQKIVVESQKELTREGSVSAEKLENLREILDTAKQSFINFVLPLLQAEDGLIRFNAAGEAVFTTWEDGLKTIEAAGRPELLQIMTEEFESIANVGIEAGRAVEVFGEATKAAGAAAGEFKPALDDYNQAMKDLGVETQEVANKKLADLRESLEKVRAEVQKHPEKMADLKRAQGAYDKAAGLSTEKTGLWEKGLKQVSTVLTDLGNDLAGRFSAAVKTGIGPIDDFTKAIIRLVSEEVMGAMIKGLASIISHIPGLSKLAGILTGIGGGAAKTAGSVAGSAGSAAGGAGGAVGAAVGGGLSGAVGLITGAVSAVSGIIGNFQMAGMNKTLDLIEHEVRFSQIHLLHILENWNSAYHGSGAWAWLLRGDTAAIAAAFKDGIVLAEATTVKLTNAIDNGTTETTEVAQQVRRSREGIDMVRAATVEVGDGLRQARQGIQMAGDFLREGNDIGRSLRSRVGSGIDAIHAGIRAAGDLVRDGSNRIAEGVGKTVTLIEAGNAERERVRGAVEDARASIEALPEGIERTLGRRISDASSAGVQAISDWLNSIPKNSALGPTSAGGADYYQGRRIGPGVIDPGAAERAPRFQSGIDFLPRDTFAMLHRGEAVIPAEENRQRLEAKQPVVISVVMQTGKEIARALVPDINELVKRNRMQLTASGVTA